MYPTFIINQDGVLRFGQVFLHRDLLGPGEQRVRDPAAEEQRKAQRREHAAEIAPQRAWPLFIDGAERLVQLRCRDRRGAHLPTQGVERLQLCKIRRGASGDAPRLRQLGPIVKEHRQHNVRRDHENVDPLRAIDRKSVV